MLSHSLLEFSQRMLNMCRSQFPKTCSACGRNYPSFKSYIETITPIGIPKIDNIEDEDPIGLMSFGNCPCGSTLTLRCESPGEDLHRRFNAAIQQEASISGRSIQNVLLELRELIRAEGIKET